MRARNQTPLPRRAGAKLRRWRSYRAIGMRLPRWPTVARNIGLYPRSWAQWFRHAARKGSGQ